MTAYELGLLARLDEDGYHKWGPPYQMSPTLEDCQFLYALIRVTRPEVVVECGCGMGVSTRYIGEALKKNGNGWLTSYDDQKEWTDQARNLTAGLPVTVIQGGSESFDQKPDIAFVDSEGSRRERDMVYWLDRAELVIVHDAMRDYEPLRTASGALLPGTDGIWIGSR